jgi:transglutaminase-like putative cysteine protease
LGLVLVSGVLGSAQARDEGADPSVTVEKMAQSFVINADGSYVQDYESVMRINEERGIRSRAQQPVSYNRSLDTLEIVEAFTQKPDGRKVVVSAEQIKEQQERASADSPMFQDSRVKVVIFPEVAVGDRLTLRYRLVRKTALFPGEFIDSASPSLYPMEQFNLTYDLPADKPLYVDAKGFNASTPAAAPGRKVYRWDYVPAEKTRPEQGAVAYMDYGQHLAVSTFPSYRALAKAYDARATVEVTPAITALANQLTANLPTPRAKALVLSDWVRRNIRYVAVYINAGGVVPHAAQSVLENRYGDCKDHVALLEALLKAVAIESTPALISYGSAYTLPKVAALSPINHAITYIPILDLFLDSTATGTAAGYLPNPDLDKPVLLTRTGEMGHTPATQAGKESNELVFKVDDSGAADFTLAKRLEGWRAEFARAWIKSMKPADRDLMIQKILHGYGQAGSGTLQTDALDSDAPSFNAMMVGRTDNLVNVPGPIGVPALSSLGGGIAQEVFGFAVEKDRTQAFTCISGETRETARFEFPKTLNILAVPKAVSLKGAGFEYSATYSREGNTVLISRTARFAHPQAVCSAELFAQMKPVIRAMANDLKSQIIVQTL